jgi:hypothetical protein
MLPENVTASRFCSKKLTKRLPGMIRARAVRPVPRLVFSFSLPGVSIAIRASNKKPLRCGGAATGQLTLRLEDTYRSALATPATQEAKTNDSGAEQQACGGRR